MDNKVQFGTSFRGFNKRDVIAYIEKLILSSEEEKASLQERLLDSDSALADKTKLYEELLKKTREFGSPKALSETIEKQNAESALQKQAYGELEKNFGKLLEENANLKSQNQELTEKLIAGESRILEMEAELLEYRRQKLNIGSVLMRAQNEADIMIQEAGDRSGKLIYQTLSYISAVKGLFEKYKNQAELEKYRILEATGNIEKELSNILGYISDAGGAFSDMSSFLTPPKSYKAPGEDDLEGENKAV